MTCHPALDAGSRIKICWIPAGVYPRENRGGNDKKSMKITARQYAQTLFDLTDGKSKSEIEKSVADFARYIYRNRKLKLAGKIIESFVKMYNQKNGIVEAEVATSEKISGDIEKKVKKYIEKKYQEIGRASCRERV